MVMLFSEHYPSLDHLKLIKLCIIHDLGEAISGDIAAIHQDPMVNKNIQERADLLTLLHPLPDHLQQELLLLPVNLESQLPI